MVVLGRQLLRGEKLEKLEKLDVEIGVMSWFRVEQTTAVAI